MEKYVGSMYATNALCIEQSILTLYNNPEFITVY